LLGLDLSGMLAGMSGFRRPPGLHLLTILATCLALTGVGCRERQVIVDDPADCDDVHDGTVIADGIVDTLSDVLGTGAESADLGPSLSWIDPCENQGMALGPATALPAGALPVLGNRCAKPGWATPPATADLVLTPANAKVGLGSLDHVDPCVLWDDFTGDGIPDVLFARSPDSLTGPRKLVVYPGSGEGTFGAAISSSFPGKSNAFHVNDCAVIDFDSDGYPDVAMAGTAGLMLWQNAGDGTFHDVSPTLLPFSAKGQTLAYSVAVLDYDRDGDLDLYAVMTGQLNLAPGQFACKPADGQYFQCCTGKTPFDDACLGKLSDLSKTFGCCLSQGGIGWPNLLLRNEGPAGFVDVGTASGAGDMHASLTASVHDFDRDGWPDLFVGNDFGPMGVYRNGGSGPFQAHQLDIGLRPYGHVMGSAVTDWNGDGWPDLVTADFGPSTLYLGSAKGFTNASKDSGVQDVTGDAVGWAMLALDLNNDGHQDLFSAQSLVAAPGQLPAAVQGDPSQLNSQGFHVAYRNAGAGKLVPQKVPWAQGAKPIVDSVVLASGDLEGDGDLDVLALTPGGILELLRNDTPGQGHWLDVELVPDKSAPHGHGALIQVWADGHVQEQWLETTPGFGAHGPLRGHFGTGTVAEVEQIRVWWPSGKVSLIGKTAVDATVQVAEIDAFGNTKPKPETDAGPTADVTPDATVPGPEVVTGADPVPLDLATLTEAGFTEITGQFGLTDPTGQVHYAFCAAGADLDGDGRDDLALIESAGPNQFQVHAILMKSSGMKHVKTPIDASVTVPTYGCNLADLNADGKPDLLIGTDTGLTVLQNQGEGDFLDKTETFMPPLLDFAGWSFAAGDLNHDQDIDLVAGAGGLNPGCTDVTCGYVPGDFLCSYDKGKPAENSVNQDRVLIRKPGQAFADVTNQYPQLPAGGDATTMAFVDLDQDGWQDLLVGNDFGAHYVMHNESGKWTKLGTEIGFKGYAHLMGWGVGDFNRDGLLDIATADAGPMLLYMQQPPIAPYPLRFVDKALEAGLAAATWDTSSWNPLVADFDQDGWEDLYLGIAGIAPKGTLGPLGACIEPKPIVPQRDLWLRNQGDGTFLTKLAPKPASQAIGFAAVAQSLLDVDGDGDLDVLQIRRNGDAHVFRNDMAKPGTSIMLRLRAKTGNTLCVGARVEAKVGNVTLVRQLIGNTGFGSPGQWSVHFGLGNELQATVTVHWPNGQVTTKVLNAGDQKQWLQP
jgi:hypothetical protein